MVLGFNKYLVFSFVVVLIIICSALSQISSKHDPEQGALLAKRYCSSCHQFPEPNILTKKSWNYLLTDMGFRLGIVDYSDLEASSPIAVLSMTARERILQTGGLIPEQPLITKDDWASIREYYLQNAPDQPLPQPKKKKIKNKLDNFILRIPEYQPKEAVITLVRIDDVNGRIFMGNQREKTFSILDQKLDRIKTYSDYELLVDTEVSGDSLYLLSIGDLMGQYVGVANGYLQLAEGKSAKMQRLGNAVTELHRPADIEFADLDGDNINELIICNFGDVTGNVAIYHKKGDDYVFLKELIQAPGAIKSQAHDFNNDGQLDIAVLLGDARENISLLMNLGDLKYHQKKVVETHSAYGHTYFELQDFNQDGHMDILAVNGDTDADPFNTLKNYHGVRIYMNDQENNFNLSYFYPMYGAHFAKANDFDQDGDLDIAASAFFPDFSLDRPEQFTYLENTGNLNFTPYTHPETFNGRWMTLDIGDYDQDGDVDIALGSAYLSLGMAIEHRDKLKTLRADGKALLVFENTLK